MLASRLGYRIAAKFIHDYFGRIVDNPTKVFDEAILHPESQDLDMFVDGINNIVEAQQRVARAFFEDGSIEECCPPLRMLIEEMVADPIAGAGSSRREELNDLFSRDRLLQSGWYRDRLLTKQRRDFVCRSSAYKGTGETPVIRADSSTIRHLLIRRY
jgi:hypothetical protein